MASAHLFKFDPANHPGAVYDAFLEFIDSFAYEYEAIRKPAPAGTENEAAWLEQDKRRKLLGHYASPNMRKDFEDETTTAERTTITFTATVAKLKARYLPTQNKVLASYNFMHLRPGTA